MVPTERDTMSIFSDSREIAEVLRRLADDIDDPYWLGEAAEHIESLYKDACDMQRIIKRLRAELAEARAAGNLAAEAQPG